MQKKIHDEKKKTSEGEIKIGPNRAGIMVQGVGLSNASAGVGPAFIKRFDIMLVIQVNPTLCGTGLHKDMNTRR